MIRENINEYVEEIAGFPVIPFLVGPAVTLAGVLHIKERRRKAKKERERRQKLEELWQAYQEAKQHQPEQAEPLPFPFPRPARPKPPRNKMDTALMGMNLLPIAGLAGAGVLIYLLFRRKKEG